MVRPDEIIQSIIRSLETSSKISDSVSYIDHEPALDDEAVRLPIVEVSPELNTRISQSNTDKIGENTNDSGTVIAEVYQTLYDLSVNVNVMSVQESRFDARGISRDVRDTLYEHDTKVAGENLFFDDGSPISEVWRFRVEDGQHENTLSTSPPLRQFNQSVRVWASEQYTITPDQTIQDATLDVDEDNIDAVDDTITQT